MIKSGDIYCSSTCKRFIVEKTVEDDQGTWVYYRDDVRQYNCLIEAFLLRFTEVVNESRK
jgi:hypothetical protein